MVNANNCCICTSYLCYCWKWIILMIFSHDVPSKFCYLFEHLNFLRIGRAAISQWSIYWSGKKKKRLLRAKMIKTMLILFYIYYFQQEKQTDIGRDTKLGPKKKFNKIEKFNIFRHRLLLSWYQKKNYSKIYNKRHNVKMNWTRQNTKKNNEFLHGQARLLTQSKYSDFFEGFLRT